MLMAALSNKYESRILRLQEDVKERDAPLENVIKNSKAQQSSVDQVQHTNSELRRKCLI
jgi:hypothetical protein